jgi:hypothetical protein
MFEFPCTYRGEPTGEKVDCGCGLGLQPIYACNLPALGGKRCLIRMGNCKQKLLDLGLLSCASCNFRDDPDAKPIPQLPIRTTRTDGRYDPRIESLRRHETIGVPYSAGPLIVDCDTHGLGDALLMAWIAEGAKGSSQPCFLRANGVKRELLQIFGQTVVVSDTAVDQAAMVAAEHKAGFSAPRLRYRADQLGIPAEPKRPVASISAAADEWAQRCLSVPTVLLAPQSNHANREWLASNWRRLAELLTVAGIPYLLIAHNARPEFEAVDSIFGLSPMDRLIALFRHARAVVAIDSFLANLSGTLDVPTLCLLSITTPQVFSHTPSVRCLQGSSRTPRGLAEIEPQTVFDTLTRMLDVPPTAP